MNQLITVRNQVGKGTDLDALDYQFKPYLEVVSICTAEHV